MPSRWLSWHWVFDRVTEWLFQTSLSQPLPKRSPWWVEVEYVYALGRLGDRGGLGTLLAALELNLPGRYGWQMNYFDRRRAMSFCLKNIDSEEKARYRSISGTGSELGLEPIESSAKARDRVQRLRAWWETNRER